MVGSPQRRQACFFCATWLPEKKEKNFPKNGNPRDLAVTTSSMATKDFMLKII